MRTFLMLFSFAAAAFFVFSCGSEDKGPSGPAPTPTNTPVPGVIEGTVYLPEPCEGKIIRVIVDEDFNFGTVKKEYHGVCGPGNEAGYSITVTPGSYYVYAFVMEGDDYSMPPVAGDYIGVYGGEWPSVFPASPNLHLSEGGFETADMTAAAGYSNMTGTVEIPSSCVGCEYIIILDAGPNEMGEGISGIARGFIAGSEDTFDYELLFPFPGTYALYGFVDKSGTGIESGVRTGDYIGGDGEKTYQGFTFYM
ncbi:MAG TPA: hypothetical protein ENN55_02650, partial [Firmicutes bacterium]|nr:hypothetical protein [Bacillota bacterium]